MSKLNILMLAGAGAVGKTALLEALEKMAGARGLRTATHKSTTRQSYAAAGIANEQEQNKRLDTGAESEVQALMAHQHRVMRDNTEALVSAAIKANDQDKHLLIADRSPYDYSGYFMERFQKDLNLEIIDTKRREADLAMHRVLEHCMFVRVIHLPWPGHWSEDTVSSDGWRADKTGKNFLWNCVVDSELGEARRRFLSRHVAHDRLDITRLTSFSERGSVEARAVAALGSIFPHLR